MRRLAVPLAAALLATTAAAKPVDHPIRLPDGRILNLWCAGTGTTTVLLDAGWSADSRAWTRVIAPLATAARVCAIDRAGAGRSSAGPLPRDGAAIAADLDAALRAGKIAGPYLLVGHSAGGLYQRILAGRRPRDVAGLVLVDPSVAYQERRLAAVLGPGAGSLAGLIARARTCLAAFRARRDPAGDPALQRCKVDDPAAGVARWSARLSELETLGGATSDQATLAAPALRRLPLLVLTAGRTASGPAGAVWAGLHRDLAALSDRGRARVVEESGHMMMVDRPDAIVAAVRELLPLGR